MAFCSQCGSQLPDGARFCPACGAAAGQAKVDEPQAEAAPVPPAAPAAPTTASPAETPDARLLHASPRPQNRPGNLSSPPIARAPGQTPGQSSVLIPAIIGVAILIVCAVVGIVLWSQRDGARPIAGGDTATAESDGGSTAPERAVDAADDAVDAIGAGTGGGPARTSAAALDSAFYSDPRGAALRYPGAVRVSGTIASMVQPGPTPALSMEGRSRFNYMIVNFPIGYRERLAPLAKGQFITVDCANAMSLGGTTILNDCSL